MINDMVGVWIDGWNLHGGVVEMEERARTRDGSSRHFASLHFLAMLWTASDRHIAVESLARMFDGRTATRRWKSIANV